MRVCDKCKQRKVEKVIKLETREVELCLTCYNHILEWIDKPEKTGLMGMFGGGK